MLVREVERGRRHVGQRAHRLDVGFLPHQHAAHVGMLDDRLGFARTGLEVATLDALLGVFERVLVGAIGDRVTLHADREARGVHHDEHVFQAAIRLADEIADRALAGLTDAHRAGRIAVDAQFVLDARADHVVALAQRSIGVDDDLRHDEERDALGAFGRARQPRENEVNDVFGHVVLAERNENFLSGDQVVVAFGNGFGAALREIRSGLRFGQTHRAGPFARHEVWKKRFLLLVRSAQFDRLDRALVEQRTVGEPDVRSVPHLQRLRKSLATVLGGNRQTDPAGVGEFLVGFFKTLRRRDLAVAPRAAFLVAGPVERVQDAGCKRRSLFQNRIENVQRVLASRQLRNGFDVGQFPQHELHVT